MLTWKTKMTGMAASAGMFIRGSYAFLHDFSSAYHNVPPGTPCNRKCASYRPCRGAMEPRADIPSPSTTGQSRLLQKESLQAPAPPGCLWEQTGLQQVLGDLRPVVSTDYELTASLPTSWRQARFVGCRPGQNCNPSTCQKQLFGLELDGQYFRFAVAHFGIKASGNAFHALTVSVNPALANKLRCANYIVGRRHLRRSS